MKLAIDTSRYAASLAAMKALPSSGLTDQEIKYCAEVAGYYVYWSNLPFGGEKPDDLDEGSPGRWVIDKALYDSFPEVVADNYDFAGNGKTEVPLLRMPRVKNLVATALSLFDDGLVSSDAEFSVVASVVSKPDHFSSRLAACMGQVLGEYSCVAGAGSPQLQINQASVGDPGPGSVVHGPVTLADTAGGYSLLNVLTSSGLMIPGYNKYTLLARLNGGTSLQFNGVSFGLLEVLR